MSLQERLKQLNNTGIPFMEGREKAVLPLDVELLVNDYGFAKGDLGDYAVISLMNDNKNFYIGGSVVFEKFKEVDKMFTADEKAQILQQGIKVKFEEVTSNSSKRKYTKCTFM